MNLPPQGDASNSLPMACAQAVHDTMGALLRWVALPTLAFLVGAAALVVYEAQEQVSRRERGKRERAERAARLREMEKRRRDAL